MIVVPAIHPAALLRSSEGTRSESRFLDTTIRDFARAFEYTRRSPRWDDADIYELDRTGRLKNLFPTPEEIIDFCEAARGNLTAVDTETNGEEPLNCRILCIGLAYRDRSSQNPDPYKRDHYICVPLLRSGGAEYWTTHDRIRVIAAVRDLLQDPSTPKVLQNGVFDWLVLLSTVGIWLQGYEWELMLGHHVVDGELPHGLAYLASRYLETSYWKDEAKGEEGWLYIPDEQLRGYNGKDCIGELRLKDFIFDEVERLGLWELYQTELAVFKEMGFATLRGLAVDFRRRDEARTWKELTQEEQEKVHYGAQDDGLPVGVGPRFRLLRDRALFQIRGIAANTEFLPGSVVQLRKLLFEKLGFPIVRYTEKGNPSTDKIAMTLLALHAESDVQKKILHQLVQWRRADKIINTYIEGPRILGDGRLHVSWKMAGTVTGRLSSSPNAQNQPDLIKRMFGTADGWEYTGIDLSQSELRTIAYLANDRDLLRMYELGVNVHTANSVFLFEVRPPDGHDDMSPETEEFLIEMLPQITGKKFSEIPVMEDKALWKRTRRLAKVFVFAENYGSADETLYDNLHAERDPKTDELIFDDLDLSTIQALAVTWKKLHPSIPAWWDTTIDGVYRNKKYVDPLSGRIQWYRAGFKRNELLNRPIQGCVASHMNLATVRIARRLKTEAPSAQIVAQIHDSFAAEHRVEEREPVKRVLGEELSKPFALPGFPQAMLPPDHPKHGRYLDEV